MTTPTLERHLACDGVFNLRDLGGYRTADGRSVRWRRLFRADGLHRAGPGGLTARDLRWKTVLDLRTAQERELGAFLAEGVDVIHLPLLRDTARFLQHADAGDAISFLASRYLEMLEEGAAAIATAFELLAMPERLPAVFHCSAGKDRTGVLAALILATLGVGDDDIAHDYALSQHAMDELVAWVRATGSEAAENMAALPPALLLCPPEVVRELLRGLRARYGSVDGYLRAIGVNADTRACLRDALLEP